MSRQKARPYTEEELKVILERLVQRDLAGETQYPTRWSDPIDGPVRCPGSWTPEWKDRLAVFSASIDSDPSA